MKSSAVHMAEAVESDRQQHWLLTYYLTRAAFSIAWIGAAKAAASQSPLLEAALLVAYPLWDALANLADGARSGGLARNRSQAWNGAASLAVTAAVALTLDDMHRVLAVFGIWAILSGLLQLGTGLRRRKRHGGQWPMMLSGAQSALAGGFFLYRAALPAEPSIASVTGYAGFGAFYFLLAAGALGWRLYRARQA